jgi:hypothetical protein
MEQPQTSVRLRNNAEAILARNSNRKSRILAEAATFTELVQNSTVFIDKTNFVFDVMKDDQSQGFWFSRRMCKSHLLTMLHTIISQEKRDEWEDLKTLPQCAKLEILKNEDFLALHENKHPALYLNLLITGQLKSFRDFEAKVSELMSEIYKQHNWLLTSLEQKIKKKKSIWKSMSWGRSDQYASSITRFKKIMNGKAERIDLSQSLKLLVEFARVYYDVGEKGKKKTVCPFFHLIIYIDL